MKKIHKLLCGLVALATAACSSDELAQLEQQHPADNNDQVVSVTAYAPGNSSSRIAFTPSGDSEAGYRVGMTWDNDDKFSMIRGGENRIFTKFEDINTFEGILPGKEGTFYALYPVDETVTDTTFTMDLSSQTGSLNDEATYMRAVSEDGSVFQFSHLTALLKPTFAIEAADSAVSLNRIKVRTSVGLANPVINLADGAVTAGTDNIITIDYSQSPILHTDDVYLYFPPMASKEKALDFELNTNVPTDLGYNMVYTGRIEAAENGNAIEAGKVYHTTVKMIDASACLLPDGETFRTKIANAIGSSSVTTIVFEVNSKESTENATLVSNTGNVVYAKVINGTTLKVFTPGHTFVFNENCTKMFYGVKSPVLAKITKIDWGTSINTERVKTMDYMFDNCRALSSVDFSQFNTKSLTDIKSMFFNCQKFKLLDLSSFNTSKVDDMFNTFSGLKVDELDIRNFDLSSLKEHEGIFHALRSHSQDVKTKVYVTKALKEAFEAKGISPGETAEFVVVDDSTEE